MKKWVLPLLLALVSPSLLAAPERVADILKDLSAHGYVSPKTAVTRLQAAQDAKDTHAPLEQRRRYYAALIALSLPDKNTQLLEQALQPLQRMAEHEHCKPCRATWLVGKAHAEMFGHHLKQARAFLKQATPLIPAGDQRVQLELATAQVRQERAQGVLNIAYGHAMKALDLSEKLDDSATHVSMMINLAVLDAQLGFLDRAMANARDAVAQAKSIGFKAALAKAYLDLGYIHGRRNERSDELHALHRSLAISKSTPGLRYLEAIARGNLADYYLNKGDYPATLKEAHKAAALSRAIDDAYGESIAVANVGIAESRMGNTGDAISSLRKSLALARHSGYPRIEVAINQELVKALKSAGRYKEALDAVQAIADANARITKQERDNAVLELQAKYDDERKTREIERLSTQSRLKDAEAAARLWQQRLWTTLAAIAVAAALLLVLWLLRARRANRRLVEDMANLTEQSWLDELTGVFNRRHFAALMQPYSSNDPPQVGLVMLDIDHFKRINDSFGHDVGDAVLVEVAQRLQSFARNHDQVVRWGGEEFVLVLHDATPQGLPLMARRLLETVAASSIDLGQHRIDISISAGCVVHPLEPGCPWEQSLRLADTAMYRAKRRGRNRAACVTTVNAPRQDITEGDLAAVMRSDMTVVTEVLGPVRPTSTVPA
ncbi:MAG: diguanylate cyclase domain-containing protein [Rhodanobacteraceae bacterium]